MKDVYLKVGPRDRLLMERIVLDRDGEDALALVEQWLEMVARAGQSGIKSHLDAGPPQ